uniref:Phospholipase A2 n=1 Tax=Sparus aurata TaxID=8175 RepID=A0A671U525_SPAAU
AGSLHQSLHLACVVSGQRGSRAFWQFGNMIRCVQPGVNPFKYNNYGSYCGLRRRGTPVDEVDLCCKVHDECYAAQMRNPRCRGFFSQPYRYQYSCSGGQPTCSGKTEPGSLPRPLNPATSHNNNNNNGGLHACVRVSCNLLAW